MNADYQLSRTETPDAIIPIPYQSARFVSDLIGSSTYFLCTPASPLPCRLMISFDPELDYGAKIAQNIREHYIFQ